MQQIDASPAVTGATGATGTTKGDKPDVNGGRFDFDDGGTYCGGWEDGKAHGHGVCTGPKGQGAYSGSWHFGFEVSGVYTWPSGSAYEGQWQNGKRHGLGVESRGRWVYRGEWTQGAKGRYGVRQSAQSTAKYEGTWASGLQDGYGSETYADGGTFQGQWLRGMRHGYGVRASAPFGQASRPPKGSQGQQQQVRASQSSLDAAGGSGGGSGGGGGGGAGGNLDPAAERDRRVDDTRGGFVLKAKSDEPPARRRSLVEKSGLKKSILSGLKLRKQRSTGDIEKRANSGGSMRSNASSASWVSTESEQSGFTSASVHTDSNASFIIEDEHMDASVVETYLGEWKNDKRSGFGISERSDGLRYEGEWFSNKKYGYGVTTFKDGSKEEGKYKNNVLITSQKKKHLFLIRSAKFRERIDAAVNAAQRASKIALQKADIAVSRTATARAKAELADIAADAAREDCEIARATAKQYAPDFQQPGLDRVRRDLPRYRTVDEFAPPKSILAKTGSLDPGSMGSSVGPPPSALLQQQQPQSHQQQLFQQQQQHLLQQQQQQQQQQYPMPPSQQSVMMQQQLTNAMPQQQVANTMPKYRQDGLGANNPNFAYQDNAYTQSSGAGYANQLSTQQQGYGFHQTVTPPTPNMSDGYPPKPAYYPNKSGSFDAGSARVPNSMSMDDGTASVGSRGGLRRNSRLVSTSENPGYNFQQAMSDHFDQYKRPPSRDSSVDRYSRVTAAAAGRLSMGSRQPSVDKTGVEQDRSVRAGSSTRGTTPAPTGLAGNGSAVGAGMPPSASLTGVANPVAPVPAPYTVPMREQPFEDVILRKRGLGQDIIPSPGQPKRTESLYINPQARGPPKQNTASSFSSGGHRNTERT